MSRQKQHELRGHTAKAQSTPALSAVIRETSRLWRRHHLTYDQTKYIVEQVRHELKVEAPVGRRRTVQRLDRSEVERLVNSAYQDHSHEGLLIKTLFLTGARVGEFVHIHVEDLFLHDDSPQIHITHAKGNADRYVPVLPTLAQDCIRISKIAVAGGFSRATAISSMRCGAYRRWCGGVRSEPASANACIRTSCATRSPRSCSTPARCRSIRLQKFLGHLHLSTTQIYAETSLGALGENYVRALTGGSASSR